MGGAERVELTLRLARERGRLGFTFATADELNTPGYDKAYREGALEALEAVRSCMFAELWASAGPSDGTWRDDCDDCGGKCRGHVEAVR